MISKETYDKIQEYKAVGLSILIFQACRSFSYCQGLHRNGIIMIIGWRKQSLLRLFSLPNDTFGSE